jgi:ribosomal protein S24E
MEFKIVNRVKNPLLNREEITMETSSDAAPSFADVVKQTGKNESVVAVKKIQGNFGTRNFTTEIFVYDSPEDKKNIEVVPRKVKKKRQEEQKKKAEEARKQAEAEKKSEEVREEKPAQDGNKE